MLITLRPGVDARATRDTLHTIGMEAGNLRGGTASPRPDANAWLLKYLAWATNAVAHLRYSVADADIDRLVLTPRYYALLSRAGFAHGTTEAPLFNGLVSLELAERQDAFETAVKTLNEHTSRWSGRAWPVVADSSFYLNSPEPLADTNLHKDLHLPAADDIHLLFPIVVVDELDGLKETGRNHGRWRAGHTLGRLDEAITTGTTGILHPMRLGETVDDEAVTGEVTVEIVLDQPGHVRLPIADDELIDRAAMIQAIAGRQVRFLTCDTGQSTRGRMAGLKVTKLPSKASAGPEPARDHEGGGQERGNGGRAQRKNRRDAEAAAEEEQER
ncbi:PIN domain-containing protein [Streptomyces sp. DvalAA-14]|uniref:hypothetical protein n=1 Tax=unclassified Streptomyces TaxID=2593676 RepID=UPI00081B2EDC|nr:MULTISPECIES: hypothetical protein [unclassified Streptomyces]MYS20486.1 hypothetical protein [Streptomyces sp. SID4948]SCD70101.1 PIN domain-containing protein [Streptomyces sp. DvalAA-14]